jgi:hypothetical protein
MTAITLMRGKKWIVPSVVIVLLMMISRTYLMAHYPSDVCAALLIGIFSGFVAWFITQLIFRFLNRNRRKVPIFGFILDFDIRDILPFDLPLIGKKEKDAAPVQRKEKAGADDDVKTYSSKRSAAPAKTAEPAPEQRRASRVQAAEAAPQAERPRPPAEKASGAARSGGRHALPEGSKSTRKSSGSYQGKH